MARVPVHVGIEDERKLIEDPKFRQFLVVYSSFPAMQTTFLWMFRASPFSLRASGTVMVPTASHLPTSATRKLRILFLRTVVLELSWRQEYTRCLQLCGIILEYHRESLNISELLFQYLVIILIRHRDQCCAEDTSERRDGARS